MAEPSLIPSPGDDAGRRARWLAALARARIANAWLRLGSSIIVACVALSVLGNVWPLYWIGAMLPVLLIERTLFLRLHARCAAGNPPKRLTGLIVWTTIQSTIGNGIAAILWFAPYVDGQTLAVIYMIAGLGNAAATLRSSNALTLAGAGPTIVFFLGLPLLDFALGGGVDTLALTPLLGALLFLGYGINLWRSLQASDAAVAQAEVAARRERQAAAAAAAAKSDTIKRMNDELRTPMTALIGAAEHLRRAAVSPEARTHIAALVQAGEVLKLVLSDLSELDRLENGQVKIEPKPTDPRELARDVIGAFRVAAVDKNLEIFLDVAADVPAMVEIDAARVRQILFNLIANAIRYTNHGGVRIRVQARACETPERVRLGFVVADTGAGMSRSQLAVVFKRERVSGEGGAGLGLAISLRLARLMGGQLAAKSDLGQGSVFSFVIEACVLSQKGRSAA